MASKNPRKTAAESGNGGRLSDLAYTRILETLFERKIPAGAFLSQNDLVELTGVPVGPLRDALRVLETEGVLKVHPRTGIQFVKPGLELTRSTYQFRSIVEGAAVAVYAETAEDAEIEAITAQHAALITEIETHGLTDEGRAEIERLELVLHDSIIGSLRNPLIETNSKRIHNYLRLVRLDRKLTSPLALRSLREHMAILEACTARDPQAAVAALQAHFTAALQRHMGLY